MRNLKVTALVGAALVSGLLLAGIGTAMAVSRVGGMPTTLQTLSGSTEATLEVIPVSDDTTLVVAPHSGDTTMVVEPHSGDTTEVVTPPSGDTTPSVSTTATPRPPMPAKARGHAYGRVILHPHTGLHRGWAHKPAASTHRAKHMSATRSAKHMSATRVSARTVRRGNSGHMSGSMMGR